MDDFFDISPLIRQSHRLYAMLNKRLDINNHNKIFKGLRLERPSDQLQALLLPMHQFLGTLSKVSYPIWYD